jgi:hypothetical protein
MSKIFVLSLHRSATQSVDELFLRAGLSAIHGVPTLFDGIDWEQQIAGREDDVGFVAQTLAPVFRNFDAASDLPTPVLYREFERDNPDARFFAIRRRPEDWVRSIRRSLGDRPLSAFSRVLYWHYLPGRPERLTDVSDAELIEMHRQHHQAISRHFSGKPTFALFDLDEPQLGERICTFLGLCPVEFPRIDGDTRPGTLLQLARLTSSRSELFRQLCKQSMRTLLGRKPSITPCPGEQPEVIVQFDRLRNSPAELLRQLCGQIFKKAFGPGRALRVRVQ